jgi:hypothetical protein
MLGSRSWWAQVAVTLVWVTITGSKGVPFEVLKAVLL